MQEVSVGSPETKNFNVSSQCRMQLPEPFQAQRSLNTQHRFSNGSTGCWCVSKWLGVLHPVNHYILLVKQGINQNVLTPAHKLCMTVKTLYTKTVQSTPQGRGQAYSGHGPFVTGFAANCKYLQTGFAANCKYLHINNICSPMADSWYIICWMEGSAPPPSPPPMFFL